MKSKLMQRNAFTSTVIAEHFCKPGSGKFGPGGTEWYLRGDELNNAMSGELLDSDLSPIFSPEERKSLESGGVVVKDLDGQRYAYVCNCHEYRERDFEAALEKAGIQHYHGPGRFQDKHWYLRNGIRYHATNRKIDAWSDDYTGEFQVGTALTRPVVPPRRAQIIEALKSQPATKWERGPIREWPGN
jgi:hypothetical protein